MGEYFRICCHTCRKYHAPAAMKIREISLSAISLMEFGAFASLHVGHKLEVRGDEYNMDHDYASRDVMEYERQEPLTENDPDLESTFALMGVKR